MMKKHLYILLIFGYSISVCSQSQSETVNFDKLIETFKYTETGFGTTITNDSVTEKSLYKLGELNVSISENPIFLKMDTLVLENPYYTDDFDDWDDNYINYPKSQSVIYTNNLISLFGNGRFVCHSLETYERNQTLEKKLNTKKFKYHWLINGHLYASKKSLIFGGLFIWSNGKWKKTKAENPLKEEPILFADNEFILYRKCSGEFGGTIYFYDRESKDTYYTELTCSNTVTQRNGQYHILAHLGHSFGTSEIKIIADPKKLDKANKNQLKIGEGNLGYQGTSEAFNKTLDLFGIQLFSTFEINNRTFYLTHLNESTFLAEIDGKEVQIVNPLFNNDKYTHDPITKTYGAYTLISMDHYGTALDREVSIMIIKNNEITLIDWNENHSR